MEMITLVHPINPEELLWFLSRGYDEIIYRIVGKSIYRAFDTDNEKILVKITPDAWSVKIECLSGKCDEAAIRYIKNFVSEWFDLDTDVSGFYNLLGADPVLGYMATEYTGLKMVGMPDLFEALCWAILGNRSILPSPINLSAGLLKNTVILSITKTPVIIYFLRHKQ